MTEDGKRVYAELDALPRRDDKWRDYEQPEFWTSSGEGKSLIVHPSPFSDLGFPMVS